MIVIRIKGGLGNQLFQYAFGRSLSIDRKEPLILNVSWFHAPLYNQVYQLDQFKLYKGVKVIDESTFTYEGYWLSENYFKYAKDVLINEFEPVYVDDVNLGVAKQIKAVENSVGVHVRHGLDIVEDAAKLIPTSVKVCSAEYYNYCIIEITKRVKEPKFFIFSDDLLWAKENIKCNHPIEYISHNSRNYCSMDMYLMSLCKHYIIPASTMSWWSAWLGMNRRIDKGIVLRPFQYYNNVEMNKNFRDLFPPSWEVVNA